MAVRPLTVTGVRGTPTPYPPAPLTDLVAPTYAQIATAKAHVVGLANQRDYIQSHIDALEADLAKLNPADVAKVKIDGYPPAYPKKGTSHG